jgi:hypothetical protein
MTEPKTGRCYGCKQVRQVQPFATKEFATNVIRDWCLDCIQRSGRIRKSHMYLLDDGGAFCIRFRAGDLHKAALQRTLCRRGLRRVKVAVQRRARTSERLRDLRRRAASVREQHFRVSDLRRGQRRFAANALAANFLGAQPRRRALLD